MIIMIVSHYSKYYNVIIVMQRQWQLYGIEIVNTKAKELACTHK
jgi:hypothetical protein